MRNPWVDLPIRAPFILPEDLPGIRRYDHGHPDKQVRVNVLPVPFLGRPETAGVVLLSLNPGYVDEDARLFDENPRYVEANRKTLTFESDPPFFYLSQEFSDTPGFSWWNSKVSTLIQRVGRERVMTGVMCVQFFPYHSVTFHPFREYLPSQHFGFQLVRDAIRDQKAIVVTRSVNRWLAAVPELAEYPYMTTRNVRNPTISPANVADGRFEEIVRMLP